MRHLRVLRASPRVLFVRVSVQSLAHCGLAPHADPTTPEARALLNDPASELQLLRTLVLNGISITNQAKVCTTASSGT